MFAERINRNMGCIEICQDPDVTFRDIVINRNMGCIEMFIEDEHWDIVTGINRNMGCIEIAQCINHYMKHGDKP